ncbi:unnamed protein product [Rotaria sp. Silwood2]|nr:unnamed protein product [Rotaria sp. Silwood2]
MVEEDRGTNGNKRMRRKKKSKCWIKKDTFNNVDEAEASVENQWSKYYTNYIEDGRKVSYRCQKTKHRGPQCPANIYLLHHADSDKVIVYQTEMEHEHHNDKVCGIDENVRKYIEDLFNDGIEKPKLILKSKLGSCKISVYELEQWYENNQNISIDKNESFIVSYNILYDDEEYEDHQDIEDDGGNKFRIFISSVHLLNIASIVQHIHVDATYKLARQGFPVMVIGTTDFNKVFHSFG